MPCSKILPILEEMAKPKTISIRELAKNAERIASDIDSSHTSYRIERPGGNTLMLIDAQELEIARLAVMAKARVLLGIEEPGPRVTLDDWLAEQGLDADGRLQPDRTKAARVDAPQRAPKGGRRAARTRARAS